MSHSRTSPLELQRIYESCESGQAYSDPPRGDELLMSTPLPLHTLHPRRMIPVCTNHSIAFLNSGIEDSHNTITKASNENRRGVMVGSYTGYRTFSVSGEFLRHAVSHCLSHQHYEKLTRSEISL